MPVAPPPGGGSAPEKIVYPAEHIREVAAKIVAEVGYAQSQHDSAWGQFQTYVSQNCYADLQDTMMSCAQPYAARLRASYDWLLSLSTALFDAADAIDQAEGQITQSFAPRPTHGPF